MALALRVTQGLADIFWVAGPLTVALILVGMGLTDRPVQPRRRRAPGPLDPVGRWCAEQRRLDLLFAGA